MAAVPKKKQALSRFFIGSMLLTQPVLDVIRRELRRISPDVKIESDQIRAVLAAEVIKRDVMEGDKAEDAKKKIAKTASKALRAAKPKARSKAQEPVIAVPIVAVPDSIESVSQ